MFLVGLSARLSVHVDLPVAVHGLGQGFNTTDDTLLVLLHRGL